MEKKQMGVSSYIRKSILAKTLFKENLTCARIASTYALKGGYKRIYHYHVKKTGGTSLNYSILSMNGYDGQKLYQKLCNRGLPRLIFNDIIFSAWSKSMIQKGDYFFGFSHIPAHKLRLPPKTFTFTCLRDPVKRVISHYKMIMEYKLYGVRHGRMWVEAKWFDKDFGDFLKGIPKRHLLRQLYMFSRNYNPTEACDFILNCNHLMLTENFSAGLENLSKKLQIMLKPLHIRKTSVEIDVKQSEIDHLRDRLDPEYQLLDQLQLHH